MMTERVLSQNGHDFIDELELGTELSKGPADPVRVREIIEKAKNKEALSVSETAELLRAESPDLQEEIFAAARELKRTVYGNRIVLFAPLYVGSHCVNDCTYCGFRASNPDALRRTLDDTDLVQQVEALEDQGHKRLIVVFGEHRKYDSKFIAETAEKIYAVKKGHGEIRRININAAPMDHEGFKLIHEAGIGTYQIFMETYHHETYNKVHPVSTPKGDYLWRLDALNRAFEAGQDDVGIGALFGLADWKFDTLALVRHALFLQERYGCGPHTISFPRMQPASGVDIDEDLLVNDHDFKRIIAILRLAVPYTGLILTARENAELRKELMEFGVSQIDAGSRIEIGGYTEAGDAQVMEREQFTLGDVRSLDEVMQQLLKDGYLPSFCTSCYRLGRTGEHFMEFAIPGFIKRYCTPNALVTVQEYLNDYASPETLKIGEALIDKELKGIPNERYRAQVAEKLEKIRTTEERDFCF